MKSASLPATVNIVKSSAPCATQSSKQFEIRALLALLFLTNLGLLLGNIPSANLMFRPAAVASGEWWRLVFWPFVHVSRYHLLLDATAFLLLYNGLQEQRWQARLGYLLTTFAGSLLLPLLISPEISLLGLCGLSGPAHGLFAISALELRQSDSGKRLGTLLFVLLLLKTGWELSSGTVALQQLHIGAIGQPIVSTHAGGLLSGLISYHVGKRTNKPDNIH